MRINKLSAYARLYRGAYRGIPLKEEYVQPYREAADEVNAAYSGLTKEAKEVFNDILAFGRMEVTGNDMVCAELVSTGLFFKEEIGRRTYVYPMSYKSARY